jgi:hypothetical protein
MTKLIRGAALGCAVVLGVVLSAPDARAQHNRSGIAGVVRDSLGRPVPLAKIFVPDAKETAVTDDSGRFDLRGLPGGANDVTITKIGFAPTSFTATLPADSVVVVAILLHRVQVLATVNVSAARVQQALTRAGFFERQHAGWGTFLTPETVDSMADRLLTPSGFLRDVRGIDLRCGRLTCRPVARNARCLRLFVDGASYGSAADIDEMGFTPASISAIEVYDHAATVPIEFQRSDGCAAVVLWTKAKAP